MKKTDLILILDFGSQFTQLIARRTREFKVYSEIHPYNLNISKYIKDNPGYNLKGVILSGGPSSVLDKKSPRIKKKDIDLLIEKGIPVMGVCYGLQLLAYYYGGKIHKSRNREYGHTKIKILSPGKLFKSTPRKLVVWMSHGDSVDSMPKEFKITSKSQSGVISGFENDKLKLYAVQFHSEVNHTECGETILRNFVFGVCKVTNLFKPASFIETTVKEIKEKAGKSKAICALSGGVDSSVAAVLVDKALGKNLICIHIDNGLMRKDESKKIIAMFKKHFHLNVNLVDASGLFLKRLKGVFDPEKKRKIIGNTFIEVFEKEAKKYKNVDFLVQGTLYPDVIESISFKGPSATIKTHHNVGGLPEKMHLKLIEPFRELFKDEVRVIGTKLGIPKSFIGRHPFPGPGLAIRVLSDVTKEKLDILREVDEIYINELRISKLYDEIWQAFAVLLPIQTVGVMGDERSYENVVGLRAVTSKDGMTADFYHFDKEFMSRVSSKIINQIKGVNRVVYDISSKPPATIEWE
ncbi:MAG: glutamine-hydrolyzing GMP synthase [Ignavibacteriae bacterium]|nr:glutamine-hydrolyzing GMP synthase [Ignavibacteriota bacterium]MCB9242231.1 glutamine-hydrolyzing GMP synthase [Ignavibacteriales bacterium]